jgi:HNH endonuclease
MASHAELEGAALRLGERVIQVLHEGSYTATYKYAVLIGLLDLCLETTSAKGNPPDVITTRQLAEKIVEIYWPHCRPYPHHEKGRPSPVLRQTSIGEQAEIVQRIQDFRARIPLDVAGASSLARARSVAHAPEYRRLVQFVEWKLVEMPLTRLQNIGTQEHRFLYEYNFSRETPYAVIRSYHESPAPGFDNRLMLQPNVGAALMALNGLLRPLIHGQWARMVASQNALPEALLEDFLFDCVRPSLTAVRPGLWKLQNERCFYCEKDVPFTCHVDHFIPWSRHAGNGIENLVVAHEECNTQKSDFLAAAEHVERWRARSRRDEAGLVRIAREQDWESNPQQTFSVARAIYGMLPERAQLWRSKRNFVDIDRTRIMQALAV